MSNADTIRAWKDEAFRESLGEQAILENPAGQIELTDRLLSGVKGGVEAPYTGAGPYATVCCSQTVTWENGCTDACSVGCTVVSC